MGITKQWYRLADSHFWSVWLFINHQPLINKSKVDITNHEFVEIIDFLTLHFTHFRESKWDFMIELEPGNIKKQGSCREFPSLLVWNFIEFQWIHFTSCPRNLQPPNQNSILKKIIILPSMMSYVSYSIHQL